MTPTDRVTTVTSTELVVPLAAAELVTPIGVESSPAFALYMARLSSGSRPAMRSALDRCARYLCRAGQAVEASRYPWRTITSVHAHLIRGRLQVCVDGEDVDGEQLKSTTANRVLSALRGVAQVAFDEQWMSAETYGQIKHIRKIRGESASLQTGRMFSPGEISALFAAAQARPGVSPASRTLDMALLGVMYGAGLRRVEARRLDVADYDGEQLCVSGKGNKDRLVPLPAGSAVYLDRWLTLRGDTPGVLLCSVHNGVIKPEHRLGVRSVDKRLGRIAAELPGMDAFTSHDFRRTFGSTLLDRGADVSTVQRLMGHSDPKTTTAYDRRGEEAKRKAVELLFVPVIE